ncbi:hypothetical protein [Mycobacteroides salmoniphilum]|uniref:hypothetical protein n=1 Tax=Mycobacteroides salmoniphilum TaxID=404941 RepID=UPI0010665D9D|nr:hypothetical protein [Mycobacteroides salmoniphilum]TDZ77066.1 hypothetical protein DE4586_02852 [Mycobacteroides salmoniphilum]TDZ86769.1 hypothetical protein DE4587_02156 [Mycobacteroides salmoniphilum]
MSLRKRPQSNATTTAPASLANRAELRDRRRKRLPIHLDGHFSLAVEVQDLITPVAHSGARLKDPRALRRGVEAVREAVADVGYVGSNLVAESKAANGQTRRSAADLAARPRLPDITDEQLVSGSWADVLVQYAEPASGPLARVLGNAHPPGADALRGNPSASERVERALRGLDTAVISLERTVPRIRQRQELPSITEYNRRLRAQAESERAQRVLARAGLST